MKTFKTALMIAFMLRSIEYKEERNEIIYIINASEKK